MHETWSKRKNAQSERDTTLRSSLRSQAWTRHTARSSGSLNSYRSSTRNRRRYQSKKNHEPEIQNLRHPSRHLRLYIIRPVPIEAAATEAGDYRRASPARGAPRHRDITESIRNSGATNAAATGILASHLEQGRHAGARIPAARADLCHEQIQTDSVDGRRRLQDRVYKRG